jgi:hypothetical protein
MGALTFCRVCEQDKDVHSFYGSTLSAGGLYGECKECVKKRVRLRRAEDVERVRAYDRQRARLPHRIANATRVTREWRRKHRQRQDAHNAAARAGLTAPALCEGCSRRRKVEKHHPDYSKPLLVVWLCKPCHAIADKIRRRLEVS